MISRCLRLRTIITTLIVTGALLTSGCAAVVFTAAAGGGGWETYQNNKMEDLEKQYEAGKISQAEFESRKKQIKDKSLLQRLDQRDQPASS
jgi:uncharacterized protein YceK